MMLLTKYFVQTTLVCLEMNLTYRRIALMPLFWTFWILLLLKKAFFIYYMQLHHRFCLNSEVVSLYIFSVPLHLLSVFFFLEHLYNLFGFNCSLCYVASLLRKVQTCGLSYHLFKLCFQVLSGTYIHLCFIFFTFWSKWPKKMWIDRTFVTK